jgi:hypothetical protein
MIRVAIAGLGFSVTWELMQMDGWTEPQLARLQRALEAPQMAKPFGLAMEYERAFALEYFRSSRTNGANKVSPFSLGPSGAASLVEENVLQPLWQMALADEDERAYRETMQALLERTRPALTNKCWREADQGLDELMRGVSAAGFFDRLRHPMTHAAIPNFHKATRTLFRQETLRQMAATAVALERHRLKHGRLPDRLEELVPGFLSRLPTDWMDGKTLRYCRKADVEFLLYSAGDDGRDDGGDFRPGDTSNKVYGLWNGLDAAWPRAVVESKK